MKSLKYLKLAFSIIICLAAGSLGSIFTFSSVDKWYRTLNKPPLNPPSWVFAPVWTLLYIMMGISLFFVLSSEKELREKRAALTFFCIQLFLNILWSALFFGMKNPFLALIDIIMLWLAILITVLLFKKISHISSYLLVPYLVWVTFASYLNYSIFALN